MKVFPSRKVLKPFIVACALLATSFLVYAAPYTPSSFFRSNKATTITVAEHSVGKNVINNSGKDYFIPTGSLTEWNSFISAALSSSGLPGISLSGLSWYASGFGGACSSTCSGYTQTQTVWCAGTDGAVVGNEYCLPGDKPSTTNTCAAVPSVCPVNGVCGSSANTCSSGTTSGYSAGSCGGSQTWSCVGLNGGNTASCSTPNAACPVNCVGSWSDTGTCSLTCGGGVKQQTYTITTPAANGGTACEAVSGATRWGSTSCNINSCPLVFGHHTEAECTSSGGTVVSDGSGNKFCKFTASSCSALGKPSGSIYTWGQYQSWTTTTVGSRSYINETGSTNCNATVVNLGNFCNTSTATCSTPAGHNWSNTPIESATCSGVEKTVGWRYKWDYDLSCPQNYEICTGATSVTATATVTEVGCY